MPHQPEISELAHVCRSRWNHAERVDHLLPRPRITLATRSTLRREHETQRILRRVDPKLRQPRAGGEQRRSEEVDRTALLLAFAPLGCAVSTLRAVPGAVLHLDTRACFTLANVNVVKVEAPRLAAA